MGGGGGDKSFGVAQVSASCVVRVGGGEHQKRPTYTSNTRKRKGSRHNAHPEKQTKGEAMDTREQHGQQLHNPSRAQHTNRQYCSDRPHRTLLGRKEHTTATLAKKTKETKPLPYIHPTSKTKNRPSHPTRVQQTARRGLPNNKQTRSKRPHKQHGCSNGTSTGLGTQGGPARLTSLTRHNNSSYQRQRRPSLCCPPPATAGGDLPTSSR